LLCAGERGFLLYNDDLLWIAEGRAMIRCGVDMIECQRIADGIDRLGERFLQRFFTAGEREDCGDKPCRLAARFAAKEAVGKALGTGIGDMRWVDIEIRIDAKRGKPRLILHGRAQSLAAGMALDEWDVSLSHTDELAIAIVVAKSRDA